MNLNVTSKEVCPYNECDGSGLIYYVDKNNNGVARQCKCMQIKTMQNRLKFANIPAEFADLTVSSFDISLYSEFSRNMAKNIKKIAIQYIKQFEEMRLKGKGLYLYGETRGSGKTRLAVSIGNAIITQCSLPVKFVTTINLLDEIKATWTDKGKTQSDLISAIKNIEVLILDDLGTEKPTSWVNETFYNILNDRMTARKVTIFTSNCSIEKLQHDSRIVNRILKMAIPVQFPEESIRANIAVSENEEIIKKLLEA